MSICIWHILYIIYYDIVHSMLRRLIYEALVLSVGYYQVICMSSASTLKVCSNRACYAVHLGMRVGYLRCVEVGGVMVHLGMRVGYLQEVCRGGVMVPPGYEGRIPEVGGAPVIWYDGKYKVPVVHV